MSPRTGRPIKGEHRRDQTLQIRLSTPEMETLKECADRLGVSRTDVVSQGIQLVKQKLDKK
jgi:Fe-S cluster assembly ATPase SufC